MLKPTTMNRLLSFLLVLNAFFIPFGLNAGDINVRNPSDSFERRVQSSLVGIARVKAAKPQNLKSACEQALKSGTKLEIEGVLEVEKVLTPSSTQTPPRIPFVRECLFNEFAGGGLAGEWNYPSDVLALDNARILFFATRSKEDGSWTVTQTDEPSPGTIAAIGAVQDIRTGSLSVQDALGKLDDPAVSPLEKAVVIRWLFNTSP
jgi:hypothetical protein